MTIGFALHDIVETEVFPEYDLLYCDPPCGQSLVKQFETKMVKATGLLSPGNNIKDILDALGRLADPAKPLYIEYTISKKDMDMLQYAMMSWGHQLGQIVQGYQTTGNIYSIFVYNTDQRYKGHPKDFEMIDMVCRQEQPKLVFDPFAGIGQTAKRFLGNGVGYIGHELNPARYAKLQQEMSKFF